MKSLIVTGLFLALLTSCTSTSHRKFVDDWSDATKRSEQNREMVRNIENKPAPESFKDKNRENEQDLTNGLFTAIFEGLIDLFR